MTKKSNGKNRVLMFGDFIAAAYRACGKRRANELVRVAVNAHLIAFRGGQHVVISEE